MGLKLSVLLFKDIKTVVDNESKWGVKRHA